MATEAIAARKAFIALAATSSGTVAEIAEVRNFRIQQEQRLINATSNDSSGNDEFIDGQKSWGITCEALYARTDSEQKALRQQLAAGGTRYFQVRPSTSQTALWKGTGFITNWDVGGPYDDAAIANFEIKGTRALTYTT